MSKAEIIEELPKLTTDELADVQARLDELAGEAWLDPGELSDADKSALDAMPFRNSHMDSSNGVIDNTFSVGVFSQSGPTAHRLSQFSRARPRSTLGGGHVGNSSQATTHYQTHLRRG